MLLGDLVTDEMDHSHWRQARYNAHLFRQFGGFHRYFIEYRDIPFVAYIVPVESTLMLRNSRKQKSKAQKLRDHQRRQRFIESKSICAAMPFYDISNEELSKLVPKCHNNSEYDPIKEAMLDSLDTAFAEIDKLEGEIRELKENNKMLHSQLSEEENQNQELQNFLSSDNGQIQQLQYDLEQEQMECFMYKEDMKSQGQELKREQSVNTKNISYILSLEKEINDLVKFKHGIEVSQVNDKQKCRKCGHKDGHPSRGCEAYKVVCRNCTKRGHFTKCCEWSCPTCGSEEWHATLQCPALSVICELCRVRGHLPKTKKCVYV